MYTAWDSDFAWNFRHSPVAVISLAVVLILVLSAVFAPLIAPHDPFNPATLNLMNGFTAPSVPNAFTGDEFLLGTDDQGRDVFSTILYGMRISLFVGFAAVLLGMVIGITAGLFAGYRGGWTETIIMRVADVQLTFPAILVAMLIFGIAKGFTPVEYRDQMAIWVLILAIGLSDWVQFARVVRGATLVEKNKEYVQAARLIGRGSLPIMFRHILPNVLSPVLVIATISLALAIIAEATLSLSRRWRTAHATLARHADPHWPRVPLLRRVVDHLLPGHYAFDAGAFRQPARRLAPRCLEPTAALTMTLLDIRNLSRRFPDPARDIYRRRQGGSDGRTRANPWPGWRIRRRQIHHRRGGHGTSRPPGRITGGEIDFRTDRISGLDAAAMRALRGKKISMIFQDPLTSLNPLFTIREQLTETISAHLDVTEAEANQRARDLIDRVGIPDADTRIDQYPHQFSGGMRQRVVIALALCSEPDVIIADEPTTALDVSIQAQILDLIKELGARTPGRRHPHHPRHGCDRRHHRPGNRHVSGQGRGIRPTPEVLGHPQHPYTKSLIAAVPRPTLKLSRFPQIAYGGRETRFAIEDLARNWTKPESHTDHPLLRSPKSTKRFVTKRGLFPWQRQIPHRRR